MGFLNKSKENESSKLKLELSEWFRGVDNTPEDIDDYNKIEDIKESFNKSLSKANKKKAFNFNTYREEDLHDDLDILGHEVEYNEKGEATHLLFHIRVKQEHETEWQTQWKAVKLARIIESPRRFREERKLIDIWQGALMGLHGDNLNFINIIANILEPKFIGTLFCYGVQSVAATKEEAMDKSNLAYASLMSLLRGNFSQLKARLLTREEADWLDIQLSEMKHLLMLRGIPKANKSSAEGVGLNIGGTNSSPESEEQNEEFIRGMSDKEYIVMTVTSPVKFDDLNNWLDITSHKLSEVVSEMRGTKGISAGVSLPIMFLGNVGTALAQNMGESNSFGHAEATTISESNGFSASESLSEGVSFSHAEGTSLSNTISKGLSQSLGLSQSQGLSFAQGVSESLAVSHSEGISLSEGLSQTVGDSYTQSMGDTVSNGYSIGTSVSDSFGMSTGQTESITNSSSIGSSLSEGLSENFGISHSEGSSLNQGFSQNFSNSMSDSISDSFSSSSNSGYGYSFGQNESQGLGVSQGHSVSEGNSFSEGISDSVGVSNSIGESFNTGNSITQGISQGHGLSENVGVNQSSSEGSNLSNTWSQSESHSISNSESFGGSSSVSESNSTSSGISSSTGMSEGFSESQSNGVSSGSSYGVNNGWNESQSSGANYGYSYGASRGASYKHGLDVSGSFSGEASIPFLGSIKFNLGISGGIQSLLGWRNMIPAGEGFLGDLINLANDGLMSQTGTVGWSEGAKVGYSEGTSLGESFGESYGLSEGFSSSQGQGHNFGNSWSSGLSESISNGTSVSNGSSWSNGLSTSDGLSSSTGASSGMSQTESIGSSFGQGVSQNFGESLSQGTSISNGLSNSSGTSVSQGHTISNGLTVSEGITDSISQSNSIGVSESNSFSQSSGLGESHGSTRSEGYNFGYGLSDSVGKSISDGFSSSLGKSLSQGLSQSSSQGISNSLSQSQSQSYSVGQTEGISNSVSKSNSESFGNSFSLGQSQSQGVSVSDGVSQGIGKTATTSTSNSIGKTQSTTNSITEAQGQSTSITDSVGTTTSTSKGQSLSNTNSIGNSSSDTTALALTQGVSNSITRGSSSSMAFAPSISVTKSAQWEDKRRENLSIILDEQRTRLMSALKQGAFYVDVYILTPDEESKQSATNLAKSAWKGNVFPSPLQVTEPDSIWSEHLMTHASVFSQCNAPETQTELMEGFMWSTILLPEELSAYNHPPRIEGGGIKTTHEAIPFFALPTTMEGESFLGYCVSSETGETTNSEYRFAKDNMMHTLIAGSSGTGKTITSTRFVTECINEMGMGATILDWKDDWRKLVFLIKDPSIFRFYSCGTTPVSKMEYNVLAIPKGVTIDLWVDCVVEGFVLGFGLGQRGYEIVWRALARLYGKNGVFEDISNSKDLTLVDLFNEITLEIDTKQQEKKAGFGDIEAYNRVLARLGYFKEEYSALYKMFGNPQNPIPLEDLAKKGTVTVIEAGGLKGPVKSFILGVVATGIFLYGRGMQEIKPEDSYLDTKHLIVFEEAHEIVKGMDTAGDAASGTAEASTYEIMWNEGRSAGFILVAIAQMPTHLPVSVLGNTSTYIIHRLGTSDDIDEMTRRIGRDPRIEHKDVPRFMERMPKGSAIVQTRNVWNHADAEPVFVNISLMDAPKPTPKHLAMHMERYWDYISNDDRYEKYHI